MTPETAHQLKRLQTLLAATSYSFPAEDAKGFPNLLPAARKIGLGRRSLTGMMTSGAKVEGPGPFESALERDYFVLLEFDQQVSVWHPQPAEVTGPAAGRSGNQKYYPDVLVERIETVNGEPTQRAELCEIKYREEIFRKWVTLKPKFKACRRYARQLEASVDHLGDRWLLAKPQPRRATREPAPISTAAAMLRQWRIRP